MKKIIALVTLIVVLFVFSSCGCEHEWADATCTTPKTCTLCGKTEGGTISRAHQWVEATCIAPKTCSGCGKTEGDVSSVHSYVGDKCKECSVIRLTLDNYEDYLDVNATKRGNASRYYGAHIYMSVDCYFEAKGNPHYKYNDVVFEIKFSHYRASEYSEYLDYIFGRSDEMVTPYDEEICTVKLNIAGNGNKSCILYTPWDSEIYYYGNIDAVYSVTMYDVISVSGTVQEYN